VALLLGGVVLAAAAAGGADPPPANDGASPPKAEAPAARLDQFGDPLPPGAVARLGTVRFRAGMWPKHLAAAPDGAKVVTVGHNLSLTEYLTVWDVATGRSLRHVPLPDVQVQRLVWLPGGRGFAVVKVSRIDYAVWEFTDEKAPPPTTQNRSEMNSTGNGSFMASAISPDGRLVAGGERSGQQGNEGKIQVWDLALNGRVREMTPRWERDTAGGFIGLEFTPDGKSLIGITQRREPNRPGNAAPGKPFPVVSGPAANVINVAVWGRRHW